MHPKAPQQTSEPSPNFEDGENIRSRTFLFSCRVVRFCQQLYGASGVARILVPQLVNASTSCASMLEEARAAESDADFISKCAIALKECRESWTRLRVCEACRLGPETEAHELVQEANELISIVTAIIRNKRRNMRDKTGREGGRVRRSKARAVSYEFHIPDS
jgi:four helix bundle protein